MKEEEIRPQAIFDEYLKLAETDAQNYFADAKLQTISCPACASDKLETAFTKKGFTYCVCMICDTLFVNPRPDNQHFNAYYTDSPSVRYWATHFYKETENARRVKIYRPRAQRIMEKISGLSQLNDLAWVADIGAGYGIFCEELRKLAPKELKLIAIEPSLPLSEVCRRKGLNLVNKFLADIKKDDLPERDGKIGVMTSFELIEHLHDPVGFFAACFEILRKGDILIFTTLNGRGLDIQVLWDKSKSVFPPHHINFFNPKSIKMLLERIGFSSIAVTTPGLLDVSILENCKDLVPDRFFKGFLKEASEEAKNDLQEWLRKHCLSSHMMVVAVK